MNRENKVDALRALFNYGIQDDAWAGKARKCFPNYPTNVNKKPIMPLV